MHYRLKSKSSLNSAPSQPPRDPQSPDPETNSKITHSPDFSAIHWEDGQTYTFTPRQRPAVALLWQAKEDCTHFVGSASLLEAAEVNTTRMSDLFKGSAAWGKVIVQGVLHGGPAGTYRLAPTGSEAERYGAA